MMARTLQWIAGGLIALFLSAAPALAAQNSVVMPAAGPMSMATFVSTYLNPGLQSLFTCNIGATAPANGIGSAAAAGQCWWDTSGGATAWVLRVYDGASWVAQGALNTSTHIFVPSPPAALPRPVLTGATTYYARAAGSDAFCTGLTDADYVSGAFPQPCAFATLIKIYNTAAAFDLNGNNITLQARAGTYAGGIVCNSPFVGSGTVSLLGDTGTPTNVVVSSGATTGITVAAGCTLTVAGFSFVSASAGISAINGGMVLLGVHDCGANTDYCVNVSDGILQLTGNGTISGGGLAWIRNFQNGVIKANAGLTFTFTANVAYGTAFYSTSLAATGSWGAPTWTLGGHTVTGNQCSASLNAATTGLVPASLPGTAGTCIAGTQILTGAQIQ